MTPIAASFTIWTAWLVSWLIAAAWASRATARPAVGASLPHLVVTWGGFVMLFAGARQSSEGAAPLWRLAEPVSWAMAGVVALGVVFAWWARIHLGVLWSGTVTRKAEHHIVDTGPYRLVRHPIYTGLIVGAAAVALQAGRASSVLGACLIAIGFWLKARLEEGFLSAELGEEAYGAYRRRTPMLIPFLHLPG